MSADNKMEIISYGAEEHLRVLVKSSNERISQQVCNDHDAYVLFRSQFVSHPVG
jgi:hypothetical protein